MLIQEQFGVIQNLEKSLIPQTNFLVGTFVAASDSKTALSTVYATDSSQDLDSRRQSYLEPTQDPFSRPQELNTRLSYFKQKTRKSSAYAK